jgi:hypothetical protein
MRFQVPQFINIEDKIFGPFTLKQFIYLAGGGGLAYMAWRFLPLFAAILVILPVAGFALALAFYKYNGRPFIYVVQSFFSYSTKDKLYLWDKERRSKEKKDEKKEEKTYKQEEPRLSESKLRNLAWSLDVLETDEGQGPQQN